MQRNVFALFLWSLLILHGSTTFSQDNLLTRAYRTSLEHQRVVLVRQSRDKAVLKKVLKGFPHRIVAEGSSFLVIRPRQNQESAFQTGLRQVTKLYFVKKIQPDKLVLPLSDDLGHSKNSQFQNDLAKPRPQELVFPGEVSQFATGKNRCEDEKNLPPVKCKDKLETEEQKDKNCHLAQHCGGENPSWVRQVTGADLTDDLIEGLWNKKGRDINDLPRVGIVDTGFDETNEKLLDVPAPVKYKNGYEDLDVNKFHEKNDDAERPNINTFEGDRPITSGSPREDESGHGTAVAGVIAGKDIGITKFARLTVYRLTEPGVKAASVGALSAAIEKACSENDIVNVSWGSLAEERGEGDSILPKTLEKVKEQGCMIIQAAGNSGERGPRTHKQGDFPLTLPNPPPKPRFKVEANDPYGSPGFFSSSGDLDAMGQGIFSLMASSVAKSLRHKEGDCCEIPNGRLLKVSGTSFSAPIMTGIAAQIFAVAKLRGHLPKDYLGRMEFMSDRLRLANIATNPILKEQKNSDFSRIRVTSFPSSYSAILFRPKETSAKQKTEVEDGFAPRNFGSDFEGKPAHSNVNHWKNHYLSHYDYWLTQRQISPDCPVEAKVCLNPKTCGEKRECIRELRRLYFVCFGFLNFSGSEKSLDLLRMGEKATFLAVSIYQTNEKVKDSALDLLEKEWKNRLNEEEIIAPNYFLEALELLNRQSYRARTPEGEETTVDSSSTPGPTSLGIYGEPQTSKYVTPSKILQLLKSPRLLDIFHGEENASLQGMWTRPSSVNDLDSFAKARKIVGQIQRAIDSLPMKEREKLRQELMKEALHSKGKSGKGIAYLLPHLGWNPNTRDYETNKFMRAISEGRVPSLTPTDILGKYYASAGKRFQYFLPKRQKDFAYDLETEIWKDADKEIFEPISSKNVHAIASALVSRSPNIFRFIAPDFKVNANWFSMLEEERKLINHLLSQDPPASPDFDMKEYSAILEFAASRILSFSTQKQKKEELATFFLKNPFAVLPENAVRNFWPSLPEGEGYFSGDFFIEFAERNANRLARQLNQVSPAKRQKSDTPAGHEMRNILRALTSNPKVDGIRRSEFYETHLKPILVTAIDNLKKQDPSDATPSFEAIRSILKEPQAFLGTEVEKDFLGVLQKLKEDVENKERAYPEDFKALVQEIFCPK